MMPAITQRIPLIHTITFGALVLLAVLAMGQLYPITNQSQTTDFAFQATEIVVSPPIGKPVPQTKVKAQPIAISPTAPPTQITPLPLIPPTIISQKLPVYPALALAEGIEGTVKLNLLVSETGRVKEAQILSSSGDSTLDQAAKAAATAWLFTPAKRGAQAIKIWFNIPVRFAINPSASSGQANK